MSSSQHISSERIEFLSSNLYENPSNALFASLFLPLPSRFATPTDPDVVTIPWKFCSEDCGHMFNSFALRRQNAWSAVDARPGDSATFPQVVLNCVLDFIKVEVKIAMNARRWGILDPEYAGRPWIETRNKPVREWRGALQNMMLVHSSWHASARHALGYAVFSGRGATPNLVQTPLFGQWTKELHLTYDRHDLTLPTAPNQPYAHLLKSLCARIQNTRLASLSFIAFEKLPTASLTIICNTISSLAALEELVFEANGIPIIPLLEELAAALSKTRHPTLQILRFTHYFRQDHRLESVSLPDLLSPLTSLPKLRLVHLYEDSSGYYKITNTVIGASWSRTPSFKLARGSVFALDELRIHVPSEDVLWVSDDDSEIVVQNTGVNEMLRAARQVEFHQSGRVPLPEDPLVVIPSAAANVVAPVLEQCTSARKLVFRNFPWSCLKIFEQLRAQVGVLEGVEELIIITAVPYYPMSSESPTAGQKEKDLAVAQLALNDAQLSQALALGLAPGLRALKVLFSERCFKYFIDDSQYLCDCEGISFGKHYEHVLPHCRQTCFQRGIHFYVGKTCEHSYM